MLKFIVKLLKNDKSVLIFSKLILKSLYNWKKLQLIIFLTKNFNFIIEENNFSIK